VTSKTSPATQKPREEKVQEGTRGTDKIRTARSGQVHGSSCHDHEKRTNRKADRDKKKKQGDNATISRVRGESAKDRTRLGKQRHGDDREGQNQMKKMGEKPKLCEKKASSRRMRTATLNKRGWGAKRGGRREKAGRPRKIGRHQPNFPKEGAKAMCL